MLKKIIVKKVSIESVAEEVYDIEVKDNHNLFVSENTQNFILAHNCSKQALFFDVLKLKPITENTKGGSTDKEFQEEYSYVPEVKWLTEYNKNLKVKSTFIKKHLKRLSEDLDALLTGCVASSYGLIGVLTGRCSANDPNLQQVPSRGPLAKPVKRQFVAKAGHIFVKIDFRSHEVNQWSNVSRDKTLVKMFIRGTKVRRKLRILDYKYDLESKFREWVSKSKWKETPLIKDKRKLAEGLKNKLLREYAYTHIDLELYGDSHKQSYSGFFGVPVELVTADQRQNVKAVIFGVIYGKQAISLAFDIFKEILQKINRKARNLEMDAEDKEEWLFRKKKKYYRAAQDLIDKLFETFKDGGDWIKNSIKKGAKNYRLVSPTGRVRHLWGYMHQDNSVHRSCDRQGPNSIIQGFASELAFLGGRLLQKCIWYAFLSKGKKFSLVQMNAVHDSSEDMCLIEDLPESMYYIEHCMSTLIHHEMKNKFDFEFMSQLEIEFEIGFSLDHMSKWDYSDKGLRDIMEDQIKWSRDELGYTVPDATMKRFWQSWDTVKSRRLKELESIDTDVEYTKVVGMEAYIKELRENRNVK